MEQVKKFVITLIAGAGLMQTVSVCAMNANAGVHALSEAAAVANVLRKPKDGEFIKEANALIRAKTDKERQELLAKWVNQFGINVQNSVGDTLLTFLIDMDADRALIKMVLTYEVDFTKMSVLNGTALFAAVCKRNRELVSTLLAAGAQVSINTRSPKGKYTPLYMAVQNGDNGIVKMLLAAGADVNAAVPAERDELKMPVTKAVQDDHSDIVALLLSAGSDSVNVDQKHIEKMHASEVDACKSLGYQDWEAEDFMKTEQLLPLSLPDGSSLELNIRRFVADYASSYREDLAFCSDEEFVKNMVALREIRKRKADSMKRL